MKSRSESRTSSERGGSARGGGFSDPDGYLWKSTTDNGEIESKFL
jgi:hypothetical protein